jgi:hypothetical protein
MKRPFFLIALVFIAISSKAQIIITDIGTSMSEDSIFTENFDSIYINNDGSQTHITIEQKWKISSDGTREKLSESRSSITNPLLVDTTKLWGEILPDFSTPPSDNDRDIIDNYGDFKNSFKNIFKKKERFEATWAGLEFAYKNWWLKKSASKEYAYDLKGGWMFRWNFIDIEIPLCSNVGFFTGLGYESSIFYLKNPVDFLKDITEDILLTNFPISIPYIEDAKLVSRYITLPVFFEVQNKSKTFSVSAGVITGLNIYNRFKNNFDNNELDIDNSVKLDNRFQVNRFKADVSLRFSYHNIQIFAEYALLPMFDTDFVSIYPFSIGLNLAF